MGKEWAVVLADLPLFEGLSKRQLGKIAGLGVARRLPPLTSIAVSYTHLTLPTICSV